MPVKDSRPTVANPTTSADAIAVLENIGSKRLSLLSNI